MENLLLEYLKKHNIPVDRRTFVSLDTLGDESGEDMLDAEMEAELPQELQHPDFKGEA